MKFRENTHANKAGRFLGSALIMSISGTWLLFSSYRFIFIEQGFGYLALGLLAWFAALFVFFVIVPQKITEYMRLMAQAFRQDIELGIEEPKMSRAEAGRTVLRDTNN